MAAGTVPALAAWNEVGRVSVRDGADRVRGMRMGGPVERLQLTAEGRNIFCRSVRAEFGNGADREIFRGTLKRNNPTMIDLPGERRNINNLSFQCASRSRGEATIRVSADVGRYADTWRRNPDFSRLWSNMFNLSSNLVNDWQYLGAEEFSGRNDRETAFAGWRGRRIDALALKPINGDARCSRVVAHFRNDQDRPLEVNRGDRLRAGQYYKLDVPGGYRNLESLSLRCRPANARRVTIQIFASK
jgi:hypothetical protein